MININILSRDVVYARMLMHEINALCGGLENNVTVDVNSNDLNDRKPRYDVIIVDLDGESIYQPFNARCVIGYTEDPEAIGSKKYSFCRKVFLRPFLVREFVLAVIELSGNIFEESFTKKGGQSRQVTLRFEDNDNVIFCGNSIHLSKNEYNILSLLDKRNSEAVSREEINVILGGECGNMCDVYICRLRQKLAEFCNEKIIYTVRNKGYMLKIK